MDAPTTAGALEELVREHAALRRVATLVAREPPPSEVFAAVTREAGELLGAQRSTLLRVESPAWAVVVASWSDGSAPPVPVGHRGALDGRGILGQMLTTMRPVRIEDFDEVGGAVAALMRRLGIRTGAGGPIILGGRVWGALSAVWPAGASLPAGAEDRVAEFAELVSHAIDNAETRDELAASRARLVEAADEARRRIERDLHDGIQQRLVSLGLELRAAQFAIDERPRDAQRRIDAVAGGLTRTIDDLREISRGIHPASLAGGLAPALKALARRSSVPVELDVGALGPVAEPAQVAIYYVVSEALTNASKHAHASVVRVAVSHAGDTIRVSVTDDGIGGADPRRGSGLIGLSDRVGAIGGSLAIESRAGQGTAILAELPS